MSLQTFPAPESVSSNLCSWEYTIGLPSMSELFECRGMNFEDILIIYMAEIMKHPETIHSQFNLIRIIMGTYELTILPSHVAGIQVPRSAI